MELDHLSDFVKRERKKNSLTQEDLARMTGVGLRFVRELEQGKPSLRMDKVNQVLEAFGAKLVPKPKSKGSDYES
ncbi:transcriptional regulator [Leptospira bouyouniensis]|uniref:Transcriptional regulator n=1 Tax=Leptospira bouyouniensis TaxID=2484911 RepID=A0A7I0HLW9_9LEPT|nr:helix-turn-helix transcriptional regulator [Leptospira bouyouniensis]TGL00802.1 transcriptional regulator [Leptospira bouyouniensis]